MFPILCFLSLLSVRFPPSKPLSVCFLFSVFYPFSQYVFPLLNPCQCVSYILLSNPSLVTFSLLGSCRYVSCALGQWGSWYDLGSPVDQNHCASQQRKRSYVTTNKYIARISNCNGIGPLSCPGDIYENREKRKFIFILFPS